MTLPKLKCLRCGHEWHPRDDDLPKVCPKCKSKYWNRPVTRKTVSEARKKKTEVTVP